MNFNPLPLSALINQSQAPELFTDNGVRCRETDVYAMGMVSNLYLLPLVVKILGADYLELQTILVHRKI